MSERWARWPWERCKAVTRHEFLGKRRCDLARHDGHRHAARDEIPWEWDDRDEDQA